MEVAINTKRLVSVEYPGFVENADRMLETLGGMSRMNQVHNDPSERLELRLRPDDAFSKSIHADRFNTTNLLIKIVRRKKKSPEVGNTASSIVKVEVVGRIETTYKFRAMADFQYLPMIKNKSEVFESVLDKLVPSGLVSSSWLQEECPLFILPPIFSRLDTPGNYNFRRDPVRRQPETHSTKIIGRARAKRTVFGTYINYDDPTPSKASEAAPLKTKGVPKETLQITEQAFKDRPIWSRSALAGKTKLEYNLLKKIMPSFGYYFLNGPWRGLWVRFGYDPRKDPSSIKYQLLDLRIHITHGPGISFSYKRNIHQYKISTKLSNTQKKPLTGIIQAQTLSQLDEPSSENPSRHPGLNPSLRYIFREGELPVYRQMFYQLCDIEMSSIQNLLSKEQGTTACKEKDGWASPNFIEKCRDILLKDAKKTAERLKKEHGGKAQSKDREESMEEAAAYEEDEDYDEDMMSDLEDDD